MNKTLLIMCVLELCGCDPPPLEGQNVQIFRVVWDLDAQFSFFYCPPIRDTSEDVIKEIDEIFTPWLCVCAKKVTKSPGVQGRWYHCFEGLGYDSTSVAPLLYH